MLKYFDYKYCSHISTTNITKIITIMQLPTLHKYSITNIAQMFNYQYCTNIQLPILHKFSYTNIAQIIGLTTQNK